ncbi:MAG: 4-hydroxy-tetrahydrodipicolinate reductase [Oscillospiraceae bacterium]|jgi:4-hydroxy-tetrahydrodipicolinate reductase|nr:4-hydroxy-tetrahydrodipicolinate reductase [Oscillospiraceae bacterium]
MLQLLLNGCYGKLSRAVIEYLEGSADARIAAGIDPAANSPALPFPVFRELAALADQRPDVILDCSAPAALPGLLEFALRKQLPVVLATTGYGPAEFLMIDEAAKRIPVFQSGNMSLGIALLKHLAQQAAAVLGETFDVEIVEAHHNRKVDAPSGTAYILGEAVNAGLKTPRNYEHHRQARRAPRPQAEIGMHAIRGGTLPGEHTVLFAGFDEVIELTHRAYSRRIFAAGFVNAARFIAGCPAGRYGMDDMVNLYGKAEG